MTYPFLPTVTGMWATTGSTIASVMFVWAIVMQYCPPVVRQFTERRVRRMMAFLDLYVQVSVHEFSGERLRRSEAYAAVEAYLSANKSQSAKKLKAEVGKDGRSLILSIDESEKVTDEYEGVKVWWSSGRTGSSSGPTPMGYFPEHEKRFFRLTCHKKHREIIVGSYLSYVIGEGKEIISRNRQRKLYTNSPGFMSSKSTMWSHITFEHPATFDTMAMDPDKKLEIIEDLLTFTKSRDFYARIGKAWKRGYLLYGPPGTGKSTMIAAMANFLHYDVYDLELTAVRDNTALRRLLVETTSKSIIVVEDIDCSLDLTGQRKKKKKTVEISLEEEIEKAAHREVSRKDPHDEATSRVTLSGLLNVIDGLWSSCGGERLMVFTTNFVEKLDPALIRRGRMDKHIELSFCSFEGFKVLAKNYLDLEKHVRFNCVRRLMEEVKMTPADVAENLMPKSPTDNGDKCLSRLIEALEEAKATDAVTANTEGTDDSKHDTTAANDV